MTLLPPEPVQAPRPEGTVYKSRRFGWGGAVKAPKMARSTNPGSVQQPSPRGRRRLFIALAVGLAVLTFGTVTGVGYATFRLGQIRRVSVDGLVPVGPGQPQTILLTGSDSRAGQSAADAQHFGTPSQVAGQRSDVIILIHLDPRTDSAGMLSIPRDFFVPIAGTNTSDRINSAFDPSPSRLIKTITADLGITINHYAQENFTGLQGIASAIGGVCMNFPFPVRDGAPSGPGNESGLNIPKPGPQKLQGVQALALVRSRYYQYFEGGNWHADGTGDIGRIQRQHEFMRALATQALHRALSNPLTANAIMGRAVHNVAVDSSFTDIGMLRLALNLRSLRPAAMPSWTLPYRAVTNYHGHGDVLLPEPAQDAQVIAAWQSFGAPGATSSPGSAAPAPSSISVEVRNGSGTAGRAAEAAAGLRSAGFTVSSVANAPKPSRSSVVTYASGHEGEAKAVAAAVSGPVSIMSDSSLTSTTVVLTIGSAFAGIKTPHPATPAAAAPKAPAPAKATAPPWDPTPC